VAPRDGIARGPVEPAIRLAAGRVRQIRVERQHLDHADTEADDHRREGEPEPGDPRRHRSRVARAKRQVQREEAGGDQQIVGHLRVRADQREPNADRDEAVSRQPSVAHPFQEAEEHEREEGRHEELAIVAGRHVAPDHSAELVRRPPGYRTEP
jgi:hypothetical protein